MIITSNKIINKSFNLNILANKVFHQGRLIIGSGEEIYEKSVIMTLTDGTKVIETFDDGKIPDYYYKNNGKIKELKITEGITEIGISTFEQCRNLEKVECPSTLVNIGKYDINEQYYYSHSFWNCTSLTTVILNKDTRIIGTGCFEQCSALTNVTLNDGLERIEGSAFYNCDSLSSITIPNSVTYIGVNALNSCKNLNFIDFGSTRTDVPTISDLRMAFEGDYRLSEIKMSDAMYDIMYNWTSTDNFKWKQLYSSPSHPTRHDTVNIYGSIQDINTPFWRKEVFSNGIVPQEEFRLNSGIASVFIDSGITEIEDYAFQQCENMVMVTLSDNVQYIGTQAFSICSNLNTINLNKGLETIGNGAFAYCTSLSSITIPNSVTSIGQSAFYECSNIEIIDFGNTRTTVPTLNGSSENFCPTSVKILVPDAIYNQWVVAEGWSDIASQIYSEETFRNKYIEVTIGGATSRRVYSDGDIEEDAFRNNSGITSVFMHNGIIGILDNAFSDCKNLTSVTFSQNIDYIGDFAFANCSNLTAIDMSNCTNLLDLQGYTFRDCTKLSAITLPPNITRIGSQAFANCLALTSITLPSTVRSLESNAFYTSGLLSIELPSGLTRIGNYCFYGDKFSSIEIPSGVTQIPSNCFAKCSSLSSVTLHEGISTIGQYAFRNCDALTSIILPNTVRIINAQAFMDCKGLTSINIPNNVSQVAANTFNGCIKLALIDFGNTRTTIPTLQNVNAFNSLPNNYQIAVPDTLVSRWKSATRWSSIATHIVPYTEVYSSDEDEEMAD